MRFTNKFLKLCIAAAWIFCVYERANAANCLQSGVHCNVDNIVVLFRHGRNLDTAPWNIAPGAEKSVCDATTAFYGSIETSYPDLKPGKSRGYFLAGEFERDLAAGEDTTTNRFIRTAAAMQLGQYGVSERRLTFKEFRLPAATSISSFRSWYCNDQAHRFPNCERGLHVLEQNSALDELKDLINNTGNPISVFVLARSLLVDVANRLDDGEGNATTRRVKRNLSDTLNDAFSRSDEYFYNRYWIIERSGNQWLRFASVDMAAPTSVKCSAGGFSRFCASIENKASVTQSSCAGGVGPSCFWMKNTPPYPWVPSPQGAISKQTCFGLDSCDGGLGQSGGGCYKWSAGPDSPRERW